VSENRQVSFDNARRCYLLGFQVEITHSMNFKDVPEAVHPVALSLLVKTVPRFTQPCHKKSVLSLVSSLQKRSQETAGSTLENGFLKALSKVFGKDWAESLYCFAHIKLGLNY
jgi:hypothetical protein